MSISPLSSISSLLSSAQGSQSTQNNQRQQDFSELSNALQSGNLSEAQQAFGALEQAQGGQAQVDQMKATGHVVLTSQGRRGTGEQLVYTGATGEYVLTGTAAAPPKMSDPEHGTVTGEALIFDSRDDRVRVEGGGRETETDTTAPDAHGK